MVAFYRSCMMKSVVSFILVVISYRIASKHFDYQVF